MLANVLAIAQMQSQDQNAAATIATQMQADTRKQQMERWRILQDTQTKIFEIVNEVTVHKARVQDKMFQKWDEYIR